MQRRQFLSLFAAAGAAPLFVQRATGQAPQAEASWPQWRGPGRDSQVTGPPWPSIGEDSLATQWHVPLQPGYSTPIIHDGRVFATETRDKKEEVVTAFAADSGEKLWDSQWDGAMKVPFFAAANGSWIRCTPTCDDKHLYVGGMRDVLVCLQTSDGAEVWKLDFTKQYKSPVPSFGFVASPLIDGAFLYVQAGGGLVKLERATGKPVWRALTDGGGMGGSAFSSPVIATIAGQRQLVVQGRTKLAGVDLESGEVYWEQQIPAFRGMNILTPLVIGDQIFTSSYGGGSRVVGVSRENGKWSVATKWTDKSEGYMSSPVLVDGKVYLHLRNRRVTCFDAASGERHWTSDTTFGKYWSMVANGPQILALDERGELLMLRATPEKFDLLERRKISDDDTWGHLVVAGRQVLVRELNALAAYRWTAAV